MSEEIKISDKIERILNKLESRVVELCLERDDLQSKLAAAERIIEQAGCFGYGKAVTAEIERLQTKLAVAEQRAQAASSIAVQDLSDELVRRAHTIAELSAALRKKDECLLVVSSEFGGCGCDGAVLCLGCSARAALSLQPADALKPFLELKKAHDIMTSTEPFYSLKQYLNYQFPATFGHVPLDNFCDRLAEALTLLGENK